jgi:hypothetical protein
VFIPLFVLVLHLGYRRSVGTSLVVAAVLSVPAVITHAILGHIDWQIAGSFGLDLIPGAYIGSRVAPRFNETFPQQTLGLLLRAALASGSQPHPRRGGSRRAHSGVTDGVRGGVAPEEVGRVDAGIREPRL